MIDTITIPVLVKPLVWGDSCQQGYRKSNGWGCEYHLCQNDGDDKVVAANAHHAAQVQAMVEPVVISRDALVKTLEWHGIEDGRQERLADAIIAHIKKENAA